MNNHITHFRKIRSSGIDWIRMDVNKPISETKKAFQDAHNNGLKIIAVLKSREMLKGLGFGTENYFYRSNWKIEWRKRVQKAQMELKPFVNMWQIDNELNHPWHNPIPSLNHDLAEDIVGIGSNAIKKNNPQAKLAVNLFYKMCSPFPMPVLVFPTDDSLIRRFRYHLGDTIDILGMDIYRGTWHMGKPSKYHDDLNHYHDLWGGDVMIMETGFCTGFLRSEVQQAQYVRGVFKSVDDLLKNSPWFKGIMWYEYHSKHSGIPCEEFFGLHRDEGLKEKPAWKEFVQNAKRYGPYNKMMGITYHY